jgi:hypothetical protein
MTVVAAVSSSRFFIYLALGAVVAFIAYRSSETFKKTNHVTPWHIPSWAWGLIGFLSLLLCVILFAIARRTTKPAVTGGLIDQTVMAVPSGWYPDPQKAHELRFWDGSGWTGRVEDGGVERVSET